jgi:hypothetical protein
MLKSRSLSELRLSLLEPAVLPSQQLSLRAPFAFIVVCDRLSLKNSKFLVED